MNELQPPDSHHLSAAQGWLELGNHLEANEELENITPQLRAHPDVLELRWQIYAREKRWEACEDIGHAIIEADSNRPSGWLKQADQIVAGDVRGFLTQYDPFRLPSTRIRELFGNLVLGFEGVENAAVSTHPEMRVLLRRLHAIWSWSGFFLNLEKPIGPANAINNYPLLGIGLSLSDFVMCR